jgi:replicative DNA helicase
MTAPNDRIVPFNVEAEEAVLGSVLLDPSALPSVMTFLKPDHFYREQNRWVYEAMLRVQQEDRPPDFLIVRDALDRMGKLDDSGGGAYLTSLINAVPTSLHIEHYGRLVERDAIKRAVIGASSQMATAAHVDEASADEVLAKVYQIVTDLERPQSTGLVHVSAAVDEWRDQLDNGGTPGQPTGYYEFDRMTGGLKRGKLYIVAARPGEGKSALMKDWAVALIKRDLKVGYFSLEMGKVEILQRIAAGELRLEFQRIEDGELERDEYLRVLEVQDWARQRPLWMDESGTLSPLELLVKTRREHLKAPFDLLIVDYLQLMNVPGLERNRVQEVTNIAQSLKALARSLQIPVVVASQMSREIEYRSGKNGQPPEPQLSDLRESGGLEQAADVVLFIWSADKEAAETNPDAPRVVNAKIAKQRGGKRGKFSLLFQAAWTRFDNLVRGE